MPTLPSCITVHTSAAEASTLTCIYYCSQWQATTSIMCFNKTLPPTIVLPSIWYSTTWQSQ